MATAVECKTRERFIEINLPISLSRIYNKQSQIWKRDRYRSQTVGIPAGHQNDKGCDTALTPLKHVK